MDEAEIRRGLLFWFTSVVSLGHCIWSGHLHTIPIIMAVFRSTIRRDSLTKFLVKSNHGKEHV